MTSEIKNIARIVIASEDFAWASKALKFLAGVAELPEEKHGFVTLCVGEDEKPQSWRNLGYRSDDVNHELELPTDFGGAQ